MATNDRLSQYDNEEYRKFTGKMEVQKAFNTLKGIFQGIKLDDDINQNEVDELRFWCSCYKGIANRQPFKELFPLIEDALDDGVLTNDEYEDIIWLCNRYENINRDKDIYKITVQELEGVLQGVLADNKVSKLEAENLKKWLSKYVFLAGLYPFDEIYSILATALEDKKLDAKEERMLKAYFSDFVDTRESYNINQVDMDKIKEELTVTGICSLCPQIEFENSVFCFTGKSSRMSRSGLSEMITSLGGVFRDNVSSNTNYLIVGCEGNDCWAYSCYGRKVEAAMNYIKEGRPIVIVHENDFWDLVG